MRGFLLLKFGENIMATASLGRLTLDLQVKLAGYEQGMTQAERKTKNATDQMNKAVAGFKSQISDALGGTYLGSIVDTFNGKIGSLRGGLMLAGAAAAGMAVGGLLSATGAIAVLSLELAKADAELLSMSNRTGTAVNSLQTLTNAAQHFGISQEQVSDILSDTKEKLGEFTATGAGGAADFLIC